MKKSIRIIGLAILMLIMNNIYGQDSKNLKFTQFFENNSLRIDYYLIGDATSEEFVLEQLKKVDGWAGPQRVYDGKDLNLGIYQYLIYDSISDVLLYKQSFCSLFNEYQTTEKGKNTKSSYYHVNLVPFPKNTVKYVLEKRSFDDGKFYPIKQLYINPTNCFIINEAPPAYKYKLIQGTNDYQHKIDIAFIAEGYTQNQMSKFNDDVVRIWNYITSIPPFDAYKDQFNIYAIESPSLESGTDIPGKNIYKNTILNSSFYTFNTDRYLTTKDIKSLHDVASTVPYDQLFVVINSKEYGGGGFYNYYSSTTANHKLSLKVALHEFGHGFAGLADEYYNSEVAYEGFYNLKTEPWEPNITTLVAFDSKWSSMLSEGVKIPTPRVAQLKDSLGVYEGGGYATDGIYSPFQDCRMKSNEPKSFCPVCSKAIVDVINFYTK